MIRFSKIKVAVFFIIIVFLPLQTGAQSPQKMSYQAVIRNSLDQLVKNHAVGMRLSILKDATAVYVETQMPVTNSNGLVTLEIGAGTPVTGTFSGIDWSTGTYFIKTETDPAGGTGYTITGTSQLLSVPYALYSKTAGGHYIGELYGGGIIIAFWRQGNVEHGLIASLTDISTGTTWSNITTDEIGITAQSPTDGQSNTNAIILQSGHISSAAKICNDYTNTNTGTGVYSDWYLPAIWELTQCYNAAFVVNTVLGATSGFLYSNTDRFCYWSSTEFNITSAWAIDFLYNSLGNGTGGDKSYNSNNRVRAVRRF